MVRALFEVARVSILYPSCFHHSPPPPPIPYPLSPSLFLFPRLSFSLTLAPPSPSLSPSLPLSHSHSHKHTQSLTHYLPVCPSVRPSVCLSICRLHIKPSSSLASLSSSQTPFVVRLRALPLRPPSSFASALVHTSSSPARPHSRSRAAPPTVPRLTAQRITTELHDAHALAKGRYLRGYCLRQPDHWVPCKSRGSFHPPPPPSARAPRPCAAATACRRRGLPRAGATGSGAEKSPGPDLANHGTPSLEVRFPPLVRPPPVRGLHGADCDLQWAFSAPTAGLRERATGRQGLLGIGGR